jgi:hypothetical protein
MQDSDAWQNGSGCRTPACCSFVARIEDAVLGNLPGLPRVHLHNKVLAYENGDEFMRAFHPDPPAKPSHVSIM